MSKDEQQLFLEQIKEAAKQGYLEAIREIKDSRSKKNKDLISKSDAYRLRGRSRVDALLANPQYGLSTIKTGDASNSTQYLSKKKLFELDKVRVP